MSGDLQSATVPNALYGPPPIEATGDGPPAEGKAKGDSKTKADLKKALDILARVVLNEGQWVEHTTNGRRRWVFHPSESAETRDALALGVKVPEHRE